LYLSFNQLIVLSYYIHILVYARDIIFYESKDSLLDVFHHLHNPIP